MSFSVILVEPQMGENIGAVARSMKNFGIADLRIVNPRDGWPNEKAVQVSVGAVDIIHGAKIFSNITDAISDLEFIYAATASSRDVSKSFVLSRDLPKEVFSYEKAGIMFGRESSGLNNKEISYANKIVTIDTNAEFRSLNLSQAVSVVCYELFQYQNQERAGPSTKERLATNRELEYFYENLFDNLSSKGFFKTEERESQMSGKIRNIFNRIEKLSHIELQTLRGIIKNLSQE